MVLNHTIVDDWIFVLLISIYYLKKRSTQRICSGHQGWENIINLVISWAWCEIVDKKNIKVKSFKNLIFHNSQKSCSLIHFSDLIWCNVILIITFLTWAWAKKKKHIHTWNLTIEYFTKIILMKYDNIRILKRWWFTHLPPLICIRWRS